MPDASANAALVTRLLRGARWAAMLRLTSLLISWGSTLVVVRYLTTADYGMNAMLEAPLELLLLASTLGLDMALTRARSVGREFVAPVFGWLLLINGLIAALYFFGSPLLAAYFEEPRLEPLAKALALVFIVVPFRVIPNAMLDRELKFKLRAGIEFLCAIVAALTTLTLAVFGKGVWALVVGIIVSRVLSAVVLMALQPWFVVPRFDFAAVRGLFAVGGLLTLASALGVAANMFPVLVAGPMLGPALLGLYAMALQFAMLPLSRVMPIVNSIAFPAFAKFEGQPSAIGHYVLTCLALGALGLLPVMVGLASCSEAFALAVLGPRWADAAVPLAVLALVMPFRGVSLFLREVLAGVGHAGLKVQCSIVPWIVGIPSLLIGVQWAMTGLLASYVITEICTCVVAWRLSRRVMTVSLRKLATGLRAPAAASAALAAGCLLAWVMLRSQPPLVTLLVQVAVGAAAYLLALRLLFWAETKRLVALLRR